MQYIHFPSKSAPRAKLLQVFHVAELPLIHTIAFYFFSQSVQDSKKLDLRTGSEYLNKRARACGNINANNGLCEVLAWVRSRLLVQARSFSLFQAMVKTGHASRS